MNTIMVSYDLMFPGQKYGVIRQYMEQHPWAHPLASMWLIQTSKTPEQVRRDLMAITDRNDKLFVQDVTNMPNAWSGMPQDVAEWLQTFVPGTRIGV